MARVPGEVALILLKIPFTSSPFLKIPWHQVHRSVASVCGVGCTRLVLVLAPVDN